MGCIRGPLRELQWRMLRGSIVLICISRKIYIPVGLPLIYLLGYFYSSTGNQISLLPLHSGSQKWRNCFLEFTLKNCLFIWLCWVLVVACEIFQLQYVGSSSWPGTEPRPFALGMWSLSHWEILEFTFIIIVLSPFCVLNVWLSKGSHWCV